MLQILRKRAVYSSARSQKSLRSQFESVKPHRTAQLDDSQSVSPSMRIETVDSKSLGRLCQMASRNSIVDNDFWKRIMKRAEELGRQLSGSELSLLIGVSSKARCIKQSNLEAFFPIVKNDAARLTALQLGNVFSAYAKNGLTSTLHGEVFFRELRARLHEFNSAVELSLASNCLAKFECKDDQLLKRFDGHLSSRLNFEAIHVRDASVIAHGLSSIPGFRPVSLDKLGKHALKTLDQATPLEISRLLQAYMLDNEMSTALIDAAADQINRLKPSEIPPALFAFGQVFEKSQNQQVRQVISIIIGKVGDSLKLFAFSDLSLILQTCSRWKLEIARVHAIVQRLCETVHGQDAVSCAVVLVAAVSVAGRDARNLGEVCKPVIQAAMLNLEISTLARAVDALNQLGLFDLSFQSALTCAILQRYTEVKSSRYFQVTVHACFASQGVSDDDDVMLLLAET